jgi:hypothetical protein
MAWIYHGTFGGMAGEAVDQPYHFESPEGISEVEVEEAKNWCIDHFGPSEPSGRWSGQLFRWFRNEQDALLFRLRWC